MLTCCTHRGEEPKHEEHLKVGSQTTANSRDGQHKHGDNQYWFAAKPVTEYPTDGSPTHHAQKIDSLSNAEQTLSPTHQIEL